MEYRRAPRSYRGTTSIATSSSARSPTGGMATVWVARLRGKHGFEKLVAIKTILPQLASDARFQQMFLDEARIASRIEHPNVAHILDLGEQHDILYIVMEWVDGESLSRLYRTAQDRRTRAAA